MSVYSQTGQGNTFVKEGGTEVTTENGVDTVIERGWILTANIDSLPDDGDAHAVYTNLQLSKKSKTVDGKVPEVTDVILTYRLPGSKGSSWEVGTIERSVNYTSRAVTVEDPLTPSSLSTQSDAAFAASQKTMDIGGLIYEYTSYQKNFTWSEINLVAVSGIGIGIVGTPTGLTGTTANHWRLMAKPISENGDKVRITERWEYSLVPFK